MADCVRGKGDLNNDAEALNHRKVKNERKYKIGRTLAIVGLVVMVVGLILFLPIGIPPMSGTAAILSGIIVGLPSIIAGLAFISRAVKDSTQNS